MPRALTFAASALSPDTTSTGVLPDARSWPITVNPSGPGIARSSSTRSGRSSRKRLTAVRPSYAVITWWPSVPTSAVIAPTIAGSSSTTRIRRGRAARGMVTADASHRGRGRQGDHESSAVAVRRLAPQPGPHGFREPPGRVQPDAGAAGRPRLAARVRLEDPLPPLLGDARPLVRDGDPDRAVRHPPLQRDRRLRRRVLDRVLDEVLED